MTFADKQGMNAQHLRRTALIVLLGVFPLLLAPKAVEAQCRKRIVVYLDISGSMKPTDPSASSPFQQTLTALEQLIDEEGFLTNEDVLELVLFGMDLLPAEKAQGPEAIRQLISRMGENQKDDDYTDLGEVVKSIAATPEGTFDQQIFVVATDFAHDTSNSKNEGRMITDWRNAFLKLGTYAPLTKADGTRAVALVQAPALEDYDRAVQVRVLRDLAMLAPEARRFEVGGDARPEMLADGLRSAALRPVEVTLTPEPATDMLLISVDNKNCRSVTIDRAQISCTGGGNPPFPVDLTKPGPQIGAFVDEQHINTYRVPLSRAACPGVEGDYRVEVDVAGGPSTRKSFTIKNNLIIEPSRSFSEASPLGRTLWLYLRMKGEVAQPRPYDIIVSSGGNEVARGKFVPPLLLPGSDQDAKPYLLTFPTKAGGGEKELHIVVEGDGLRTDTQATEQPTPREHWTGWLQLSIFVLAPLAVLLMVAWAVMRHGFNRAGGIASIGAIAISSVTGLFNWWLSEYPVQTPQPFEVLDFLQLTSAMAALFFVTNIGLRFFYGTSLRRSTLTRYAGQGAGLEQLRGTLGKDPESYLRGFQQKAHGGERAAFHALLLTLAFCVAWFLVGSLADDPRQLDELQAVVIPVTDQR